MTQSAWEIPCGHCNRGEPFDGPYDVQTQCRMCWLYHNDFSYRAHWDGMKIDLPVSPSNICWAYGITTVPSRRSDLLPKTMTSLREAGFDQPHLFVDGGVFYDEYPMHLQSPRFTKLRTAANWVLSLHELFIREPLCDRYAIFQDDIIAVKNLRAYLDGCQFPDHGYWNLYTYADNQALAKGNGWYLSRQNGLGALGLVFDKAGVISLLTNPMIITRPTDLANGWRNIDGGIVTAMRTRNYQEWVHSPSLLQHTGTISAIGNGPKPLAPSFPGEDFDATLLRLPTASQIRAGWGDQLEQALSMVGITKERVSQWLGAPCNCQERQEKINALGSWVKRTISGKVADAKSYLEKIIG